MSETEELKKNAQDSKNRQTMREISEYLDRLTDTIELRQKQHHRSSLVYLIVWIAWVASAILTDTEVVYWFAMIFIAGLIYDQHTFANLKRAYGEFFGALEVLKILGLIPPVDGDKEIKNKEVKSPFIEMVKGWVKGKKEAQEKVYAPA